MQRTKDKRIKIVLIVILIIIYILPIHFHTNMWYSCLIYQFFHANIFHLAANIYALFLMKLTKEKIIASYVISIIPVIIFPEAIGISGMILANVGMYSNKKTWIYFLSFSLITAFIPNMAFAVHTICFVLGCIYGKLSFLLNEYRRAYTRRR